MKHITTVVALVCVATIATECQAQRPGRGGQRARSQGEQRQRQRPQGQRPGAGDPAQVAARMLANFDKNGDMKLDGSELAAMFKSMRENRGQAGQGNMQGRRAQDGRGAGEGRPSRSGGRQGGREGRRASDETGGAGFRPRRPTGEIDEG